jgi:hypothetical protein
MLLIGVLFSAAGIGLTFYNRRFALSVFGRDSHSGTFKRSIGRQNTAIIGAALLVCGLSLVYSSLY